MTLPLKRPKHMKLQYEFNGKPVPKDQGQALSIAASNSLRLRHERGRLQRLSERHSQSPDRLSISNAMSAIEDRLVRAFWVLGRSVSNPGPKKAGRNGIDYLFERGDQDARYADAAAKNWESVIPQAPVPFGREVDAADRALEWLQLLSREEADILTAGARSKSGDVNRRVNWERVRLQLPKYSGWSSDRLRRTYTGSLRYLVGAVAT